MRLSIFWNRQACNIMGFLDYLWRRGLDAQAPKDVYEGGQVWVDEATVVKHE